MTRTKRRPGRPVSPELQLAAELLEGWGNWYASARADRPPNGWRNKTIAYRLQTEGLVGAAHAAPPAPQIPRKVEFADMLVGRLPRQLQNTLKACYGPLRNAPLEAQAHTLRLSPASLSARLQNARYCLAFALSLLAEPDGFEALCTYLEK